MLWWSGNSKYVSLDRAIVRNGGPSRLYCCDIESYGTVASLPMLPQHPWHHNLYVVSCYLANQALCHKYSTVWHPARWVLPVMYTGSLRFVKHVLGHVLRQMLEHMREYMLWHVPKHVLWHVLQRKNTISLRRRKN